MAQLDVEPKKNNSNDWWKWLLGILALIIIVWVIMEYTGDDDEVVEDEIETVAVVEHNALSATPVLKS